MHSSALVPLNELIIVRPADPVERAAKAGEGRRAAAGLGALPSDPGSPGHSPPPREWGHLALLRQPPTGPAGNQTASPVMVAVP